MSEKKNTLDFKFKYHPVGQGLFYTGKVGETYFVYDCGSESKTLLEDKIDDYLNDLKKKQSHIDYLFISHFDVDHINGLEYLLNKIKVKNFILPYFSLLERFAYYIKNDVPKNIFLSYFLLDPVTILLEPYTYESDIIPVDNIKMISNLEKKPNENERYNGNEWGTYLKEEKLETMEHISNITLENKKWVFRTFNRNINDSKLSKFEDEINKIGVSYKSIKEEIKKTNTGELKDCYENVFGKYKLNDTSLVLYHGPNSDFKIGHELVFFDETIYIFGNNLQFYNPFNNNMGYLLTGDIKIDEDIKNHYSDYLKNVSIGTLPHHGSHLNFNKEVLNWCNNSYLWINSSSRARCNCWKHPHFNKVVIPILEDNKNFGWCNKNNSLTIEGTVIF